MEFPRTSGITSPCYIFYKCHMYSSNLPRQQSIQTQQPSPTHSTNSENTATANMTDDSLPTEYTYVRNNQLSDHN
jgi:hypothetical protein